MTLDKIEQWKKEFEHNNKKQKVRRIALVSYPIMMVVAALMISLLQMLGYAGSTEDTMLGFNA